MNGNEPNLHLWLIPLLPLIGAALNGLLGRNFSKRMVATIGLVFVAAAFLLSAWASMQLMHLPSNQIPHIEGHSPWIISGGDSHSDMLRVDFSFYLDQLSMDEVAVQLGLYRFDQRLGYQ